MSSASVQDDQKDLPSDSNNIQQVSVKPMSYSTAVSEGLSEVVKFVVVESMAWQRDDELAKYVVAICGLPKQSHDLKEIYSILRKVGSKTMVRNLRRIGHAITGAS